MPPVKGTDRIGKIECKILSKIHCMGEATLA